MCNDEAYHHRIPSVSPYRYQQAPVNGDLSTIRPGRPMVRSHRADFFIPSRDHVCNKGIPNESAIPRAREQPWSLQ
jgi:hypothetical protein